MGLIRSQADPACLGWASTGKPGLDKRKRLLIRLENR
jgi:hypothetical protein